MWTGVSVNEFTCVRARARECVNAGMRESGSVRVGTGLSVRFMILEIKYKKTMVTVGIFTAVYNSSGARASR